MIFSNAFVKKNERKNMENVERSPRHIGYFLFFFFHFFKRKKELYIKLYSHSDMDTFLKAKIGLVFVNLFYFCKFTLKSTNFDLTKIKHVYKCFVYSKSIETCGGVLSNSCILWAGRLDCMVKSNFLLFIYLYFKTTSYSKQS